MLPLLNQPRFLSGVAHLVADEDINHAVNHIDLIKPAPGSKYSLVQCNERPSVDVAKVVLLLLHPKGKWHPHQIGKASLYEHRLCIYRHSCTLKVKVGLFGLRTSSFSFC